MESGRAPGNLQPQLTWRNEIKKSNNNALAEIEIMWERTERFVEAMSVKYDEH